MSEESPRERNVLKFQAAVDVAPPVPRLSYFLALILFVVTGGLLMWGPTRWVADAFHNLSALKSYDFSGLLSPSAPLASEPLERPAAEAAPGGDSGEPAPAKKPRPVVFRLLAPAAKAVFLGGTFNDFDARRHPMARGPEGLWEATLELAPGRYFYKFKVDGRWELDPTNPERTPDPRASSILEIQ